MSDADGPDVEVSAVCSRDRRLLMIRVGHGPAGGEWRLPGGAVARGETLAEAVVSHLGRQCGRSALCGPFLAWREHLEAERHVVRMYFEAVDMDDPDSARAMPGEAVESEWVDVDSVLARRLEPGLAEFLAEAGVIDAVV